LPKEGFYLCSGNTLGLTLQLTEALMRALRHNPHPVDIKDFLQSQIKAVPGKEVESEEWDEELTDAPVPAPTIKSNLLKFRKRVSEKLYSIEFGKISF
jgi:hypothetical protein